jgi:DNA-binding transcriptional ArsR family regulator
MVTTAENAAGPIQGPIQVIQSADTAATLFSPARLRILEHLSKPDSAAGVARRLELPRQQIGYHLRELEQAGLVELVEERRKGNCIERVVRTAAQSFVISPIALGKLGLIETGKIDPAQRDPARQSDRFSAAYLVSLAARAIRDLAVIFTRAQRSPDKAPGNSKRRVSTMALEVEIRFASAESRHAFAEELAEQVARLAAKYHDESAPGGRKFRFFGGVYPAITREEPVETNSIRIQ